MGLNADPNQFVLLHNPACSKSKAALKLLEEGGILFRVREYLSEPLDEQELLELGGAFGPASCRLDSGSGFAPRRLGHPDGSIFGRTHGPSARAYAAADFGGGYPGGHWAPS